MSLTETIVTRSQKPPDYVTSSIQRSRGENWSGTATFHDHLTVQRPTI